MWNRPTPLNGVFLLVTYLCRDHLAPVIRNKRLYTMNESWTEFAQYTRQSNIRLVAFQPLLASVEIAYGLTRLSHPIKLSISVEALAPGIPSTVGMVAENLHPSRHAPYTIIAKPVWKYKK